MLKRLVCIVLVALLLTPVFALRWNIVAGAVTITVPTDFGTIQEAINNAADGDTVFVLNGTYTGNVVVNKSISLIGQNKSTTSIDGGGAGSVVFVSSSNVSITNFTIQNSGSAAPSAGIYINQAAFVNITGNDFRNNYFGMYLLNSTGAYVGSNTFFSNSVGIHLQYS